MINSANSIVEDKTVYFDGDTYSDDKDRERLSSALERIAFYLIEEYPRWHTLPEIAAAGRCSEAGASARVRDLRKSRFAERFGVLYVESRRRREGGTWEYRAFPDPDFVPNDEHSTVPRRVW